MDLVKQKAYQKVFEIARSQLSSLPIEDQARKADVVFSVEGSERRIALPFFDETIELVLPGFSFRSSTHANVTLATKIMILHYLIRSSGIPTGSELVAYEDIPGCRPYLPVFERRVVRPLLTAFAGDRDAFSDSGRALGGIIQEYGNASFQLHAFPRVPITFVLWEREEDFPAAAKVLFDRSVHSYLPLEDVVVISKMAVTRILKQARRQAFRNDD